MPARALQCALGCISPFSFHTYYEVDIITVSVVSEEETEPQGLSTGCQVIDNQTKSNQKQPAPGPVV